MRHRPLALLVMALASGCATSKVVSSIGTPYSGPRIKSIAISPGGGVLAEAVGVELFNLGYRVIDPGQMERLVGRSNVSEFEIGTPKSLEALHAEGIDALLIVKSTTRSTGRTDAASVRL